MTNLNKWVAGRRRQHVIKVAKAETDCYKHNKSKDPVCYGRGQHDLWDCLRGISDLLRNMYNSIGTDERYRWAQYSYKSSQCHAMPVTAVIELDEYIAWRGVRSQSPKGNENSDEARNMQQQYNAFDGRQIFGQDAIDKEGD